MCRRILVALCILLMTACGGAASQAPPGVRVVATEFHFEPSALTLTAGAPMKLTFKNAGQTLHDFTIVSGPGGDKTLDHVAAEPNKEATLTLDLPAGSYTFICSVPGHKELGMQGTIAVQ